MTGMKNKQEYEEELEMGKGGFTLPGESGYEELTLKMAEKWGADVIRDSDGTVLSDEITHAGYGIYSTICIIRDHNAWAKEKQDKLQQPPTADDSPPTNSTNISRLVPRSRPIPVNLPAHLPAQFRRKEG